MTAHKPTPGPWHVESGSVYAVDTTRTTDVGGSAFPVLVPIAHMDRDTPSTRPTERDANAHHIVACVNAYHALAWTLATSDALLEACEAARGQLDARNPARAIVDAAIARARGPR